MIHANSLITLQLSRQAVATLPKRMGRGIILPYTPLFDLRLGKLIPDPVPLGWGENEQRHIFTLSLAAVFGCTQRFSQICLSSQAKIMMI